MQNIINQGSEQRPVHSTSNCKNTRSLGWNSSTSYYPPYYLKNMNLNMDSSVQNANQLKHVGNQIGDQDYSSTQSTGQSHQEVSGSSEGYLQEQCVSTQSGNDSAYAKHVESHMKSALSLGSPEASFMPPKLDYNPSVACMPYAYDACYGAVLAPYGSHAIIHPQTMGMMPLSRVPLPHEQSEEEPIYVNAKQYHAILRRRELRAKQEAQNTLIKGRKPYLHESRHIHAMKRARGVGGRFLNTKKLQELAESRENGSMATPTSSEVTSGSNGGAGNLGFHHPDHFGFSTGQSGGRIPIIR